ncbi:MAG: PAS domain-containing protein, partial [Chloroflexi bacterium]|nr:PAS domain-containing protein [Chloroflexota bacterium]
MITRFGWRFHSGRFTRARLLIVGASLLFFVLAHGWFGDTLGAMENMLAVVPLLLAAWFLGHAGSMMTLGIVVLLHFALSYLNGEPLAAALFLNDLPGISAGFVVSFITGWLSDLLARVAEENVKRQKVEAELRLLNEELEQRVLDRTKELGESNERIERAKKEWETTVDALSDLILLTNEDGVVVRCNRATVDRFQKEYDEVLNHPLRDLFCGAGDDCHTVFGAPSVEYQFQNLAGWHHILNHQVQWDDGKLYYVHIIRDITASKQMQAAMTESQKMADLGTLSAGVAHEMNSPLQVIIGVSQMALRQMTQTALEPDQLRSDLEMICRNGWRCAEIVRSLRAYAHISSDQYAPADLNEIVRDTLLLTAHQLKSWSNISVVTDLVSALPKMECDRNRIAQVLINMITNARDAMPDGGEITIHTKHDPLQGRLRLEVSDTGGGIPVAVLGKIFDPFFTTKPIGQGTGLGLSIVAGILRAHGGEVQVTSVLGKGTKFTMSFPLKQVTLPTSDEARGEAVGRFDDSY